MTDKQAARLAEIRKHSPKVARIFERVYTAKRPGRRDILKAKCMDCAGYERTQAAACSSEACPLYSVNPYRTRKPRPLSQPPEDARKFTPEPAGVSG